MKVNDLLKHLFFDYLRKFNTDIKVVRIFNTYGPNMRISDGRVISNIITQSIKNQDVTIHGDGMQTRSFCYVDDLIDIILKIMNSKKGITGPFNVGNPSEFKIIDIAKKIINLTNSKSTIKYLDLPEDDPKQRKPDISLVKETFNWNPKIETEEGLKKQLITLEKNYSYKLLKKKIVKRMVGGRRLELRTNGLKVRCSTN